ncbi:MAG: Maf family nucleotide pyrophosphatase [Anaerolineae bacterium]
MVERFILASGSPRRREMVASLGIDFEIIKPDVDESQLPGEPPFVYVKRLSLLKANTVAALLETPATILAADTIVILAADTIGIGVQGEILGKPLDADDARQMLRRLRDDAHIVCTAFTLKRLGEPAQTITRLTRTTVTMRPYTDAEINAYIASGDPFDKAGSYAIQNADFHPVAHIEGCYDNVVGLPLCAVQRALVEIGWPGLAAPADCDCETFEG